MKIPFLLLLGVLFVFLVPPVFAQTSDYLIITWRTENLYPANFEGRAMPTPGSSIRASVEAVVGGKLANLATADILWFLDEALLEKGVGIKTAHFTARSGTTNNHFLRAQVRLGNKTLEESVRIPVKHPRVVVEIPILNKILPGNSELRLSAVPYFFNAGSLENLVFNWIINNTRQKQTGNGELTLKIGQPQSENQQKMVITANIQNLLNPLEVAQQRGIFSISQ
jgi:hypothetical protein